MSVSTDQARARRYLLGEASERECADLEQDYLQHEEVLDLVAAAEDDLIEDYLSGALGSAERERFERSYLSTPNHRVRVETVRRLMAQTSALGTTAGRVAPFPARLSVRPASTWLALAASLLVVAALVFWRFFAVDSPTPSLAQADDPPTAPAPQASPSTPPSAAPRTFALTISPVGVRSDTGDAPFTFPQGTDLIVIDLEREVDGGVLVASRAAIRTVPGDQVWQSTVAAAGGLPPGIAARLEVPAGSLAADDYVVTLYGRDRAGVEREWARYFLRVR